MQKCPIHYYSDKKFYKMNLVMFNCSNQSSKKLNFIHIILVNFDSEKKFDINKGIMVVLDVDKGELSFEDEDGNYGIAFQDIVGSAFYPFLLFKNPVYPVQISYLDGPDGKMT